MSRTYTYRAAVASISLPSSSPSLLAAVDETKVVLDPRSFPASRRKPVRLLITTLYEWKR